MTAALFIYLLGAELTLLACLCIRGAQPTIRLMWWTHPIGLLWAFAVFMVAWPITAAFALADLVQENAR